MAIKQKAPEYDTAEVITFLRMTSGNTVRELQELSYYLRDSPVSGDAIGFFRSLAKTPKVEHNEGMDNNTSLRLSTATVFVTDLGIQVPVSLTVHYDDTDYDQVFIYSEGVYMDKEGNELYLEPRPDGVITTETYFEVPESM